MATPPSLQVYPPFLAKNSYPPPKWLNFRKVQPPFNKRGGDSNYDNPNDVMVVVLKHIILCLLGFRFIHIVYIVAIIYKTFQMCYHQHACLLVCLSLLSACLSVKLQWMIQVTREIQGNSWFQEFWVCCK